MADTHPTALPTDTAPLLQMLAAALQDDPFYQAVTVDFAAEPARRAQCLQDYFRPAWDEAPAIGRGDRIGTQAAAIWTTSQDAARRSAAAARKAAALRACLGPQGWHNYHAIVAAMDAQLPASLGPRAWYLSILGVDPVHQGAGLGARVIAPVLAEADAQGMSCYIETFNPRSVPFYERQGFTEVHACFEPVTQSAYWTMVRAPRHR
ncbi:GNAT family N-acetyltransferase [Comamonas sediminis]|uniref:GNAT family N-acetyltransferase n=1 Tax=Comamonas sediminis TaxID=1783360 RepID=UPI003D2C4636